MDYVDFSSCQTQMMSLSSVFTTVCMCECVVGIKEVVGIFWPTLGCAGIKSITWFSADDILISHLLFVSATRHTSCLHSPARHPSVFAWCEGILTYVVFVKACIILSQWDCESKN